MIQARPDRKKVDGVFFDPTKYNVIVKPIIDVSGDKSVDFEPQLMDVDDSGFQEIETPKRQRGKNNNEK